MDSWNAAGYVVWPTARGTASTAGPYHRPRQTMAARLIRRYVRGMHARWARRDAGEG